MKARIEKIGGRFFLFVEVDLDSITVFRVTIRRDGDIDVADILSDSDAKLLLEKSFEDSQKGKEIV